MGMAIMEQLPVFVYGSLRQGFHNHKVIENDYEKVEKASIEGFNMYAVAGRSFPGIVKGDGEVFGELYWLKPEAYFHTLAALDSLEGYNYTPKSMYLREKVVVQTSKGSRKAYVYVWNYSIDERTLIESGDWSTFSSTLLDSVDDKLINTLYKIYSVYDQVIEMFYDGVLSEKEANNILNELEYVAGMLKK